MTAYTYATREGELPSGTLVSLFLDAIDRLRERHAFRIFTGPGPELREVSYRELFGHVKDTVGAFRLLGLERGDRAAILSENRFEWALTDYACLFEGVWNVPIHSVLTAEQIRYIVQDSGVRVLFVSSAEQVAKAKVACAASPHKVRIVAFEPLSPLPEGVFSWDHLVAEGRVHMQGVTDEALRTSALQATPDQVATMLYTSGTTGNPKGVVLTHRNLFSNVEAASLALHVESTDSALSFLPLSHVFQRMVDYVFLSRGCTISYPHSKDTLAVDLRTVRPTIVGAVPRVYEKVYGAAVSVGGAKGRLVRWAREVGLAWASERLAGRIPTLSLRVARRIADALVFAKIRAAVGGRVRIFASGSAPLDPEIARFFYAANMPILEGYGLTETSPVLTVNTPDEMRVGTVGRPVVCTQIRIADDGEILAKGPQVMRGYFNRPEETADAIDPEGWLHTGDIGELDAEGYLRITDRKKDLIKTSGGKYVAPQPIENRTKRNAFVDQAIMVGDRRKFVALLVVPDFGVLERWAREQGVPIVDREVLISHPAVQEKMAEEALSGFDDLSHTEIPRKLALLTTPFSIEDGTLTLTDKVKRRVVQDRYASLVDRFYQDENSNQTVFTL
ncbi:MAG TPA: long-chain fatty acid--CoA ligase [Gemmatimonadetes bacterium]|nr:long-chain fatty acid--CoA ligase [Gemmatimonadota bacterium]|tara:strand:- start:9607 stop:11460 length:1854 start_codon:yes stop_codon:yes gene_type:complete